MLTTILTLTAAATAGALETLGTYTISRRSVLSGASLASATLAGVPAAALADDNTFAELSKRLDAPLVTQTSTAPSMNRREPLMPSWLVGDWQVEQTLQRYSTPQGVQFIGAAGRPLAEAEASAAQTRAQIGKPVTLELRWRASDGGAVEDRAFNAGSRFDAFAGRPVVKSAKLCADAGYDSPGIACTFVDFNGPIVQKQFVNSVRLGVQQQQQQQQGDAFISADVMRTILARRTVPGDTRTFPPLTVDSEVIMSLAPQTSDAATGRLRLVEYLNPQAPLYFAAGGKSVSISDYSLTLVRRPQ